MKRPSTYGAHHGAKRRPPSPWPAPAIVTSAPKRNLEVLLNTAADAPPSSENDQLWRLAKPTHRPLIDPLSDVKVERVVLVVSPDIEQKLKVPASIVAAVAAS